MLGTKNLTEILSEREKISEVMQSSLDSATDPWGVKVERVEIKDVRLPVQLQRAMAAEAEAAREARAKVIMSYIYNKDTYRGYRNCFWHRQDEELLSIHGNRFVLPVQQTQTRQLIPLSMLLIQFRYPFKYP